MPRVVREKAPLAVACVLVAAAIAFSIPDSSRLGSAFLLGKSILAAHGLPTTLGEGTFSAPHDRWFDVGWLTALVVTAIRSLGGYPGLVFSGALTATLAMLLVERRCAGRGLGSGATALALAIALLMSIGNLRVGGGLADLFFAAAFLYAIERPGKAGWCWALALTVLWCNASPSGLIVPLIVELVRRSPASIAFFFAVFATPAGERLFMHGLAYLRVDGMNDISTWQPMRVNPRAFIGGFLPATILAGWIGLLRSGKADVGLTLYAMMLAQLNGYYLGIAGVIMGPIVATAFERFCRERSEASAPESSRALPSAVGKAASRSLADAAAFAGLAFVSALLALPVAHLRGLHAMDGIGESNAAAEMLVADGRPHRLYCADPNWCDAVLLRGDSNVRVFLDGRHEDYPDAIRHASDVIAFMDPGWRGIVDKWKIDAIEAPSVGLGGLLTVLPGWHCVYSAEHIRLFERRP